jgi:hypothetical protein
VDDAPAGWRVMLAIKSAPMAAATAAEISFSAAQQCGPALTEKTI